MYLVYALTQLHTLFIIYVFMCMYGIGTYALECTLWVLETACIVLLKPTAKFSGILRSG